MKQWPFDLSSASRHSAPSLLRKQRTWCIRHKRCMSVGHGINYRTLHCIVRGLLWRLPAGMLRLLAALLVKGWNYSGGEFNNGEDGERHWRDIWGWGGRRRDCEPSLYLLFNCRQRGCPIHELLKSCLSEMIILRISICLARWFKQPVGALTNEVLTRTISQASKQLTYRSSSFHSMVTKLFSLTFANAYIMWVQRLGSIFFGRYWPAPGRYWDQLL